MKIIYPALLLPGFFFLLVATGFAQTNQELAVQKAREAIRLEDQEHKYDEAIALLLEAQQLDPANINYPYELAYTYSIKKDYKTAIKLLTGLLDHKDVNGRVYQMLGNAYDYQNQSKKAIETYKKGLEKFPASGELYLELGNMEYVNKEFDKALGYYEKGIEVNPQFPSNYYRAAKIYLSGTEEVWGMIYGEIFMNLERNSSRTVEMSKLLFDTYKSEIKFKDENNYSVSFSQNSVISFDALKDPANLKLPFGTGVYEMILSISVAGEKQIDIESLDRIRGRFLDNYFSGKNEKKYPNLLFDFQKQIKDAGHLEAYNHWLLMKGDEQGFENWAAGNKEKMDAFISWFRQNMIPIAANHKFFRAQYN